MSRCFPYPPPGYTLSRASNEALIESIKLRNEREKAKEQKKKEKRRDKKDKRKEKKEKRKNEKKDPDPKLQKSDVANSRTLGQNCPVTKDELPLKGKEAQIEQLEGSSLTKDHGLPPVRSDFPSTSSDSTNTSNKRKRNSLPLNESHGHGKIIRIKLNSNQNGSNAFANANEMRPCSKSGNALAAPKEDSNNNLRCGRENSSSALKIDGEQICSTSQLVEGVTKGKIGIPSVPKAPKEDSNNNLRYGRENTSSALKIDGEQICSTSQPVEGVTKGKNGIPFVPKAVMTCMQREELNYNKLVGNWSPPQQQNSCLDVDDLDWLLQFRNPAEKRPKIQDDGVSCSSNLALRPRAQLLNEFDIFALPFTVPF